LYITKGFPLNPILFWLYKPNFFVDIVASANKMIIGTNNSTIPINEKKRSNNLFIHI